MWAILPLDSGLEVLAVQRVSKTQAWQRTGRAGREDSGVCYRLYTEDEFEKFEKMTVPEIQRWARDAPHPSICPTPPSLLAQAFPELQFSLTHLRVGSDLPAGGSGRVNNAHLSLCTGATWRA